MSECCVEKTIQVNPSYWYEAKDIDKFIQDVCVDCATFYVLDGKKAISLTVPKRGVKPVLKKLSNYVKKDASNGN